MNNQNIFSDSFFAMGTRCDVVFPGVETRLAERVFRVVKNEIENLEYRLSRFIPYSPVSELNKTKKNKWTPVPDDLWNVITVCYDFWQMSNGAFDITASPLINLWKSNENPTKEQVLKARQISGFDKIEFDFDNQEIKFLEDKIEFDFGAIGKGIALDSIKPMVLKAGIKNGIISFGESSTLALGKHPNGKNWPLGIRNAFDLNEYVHVFSASDETVTTSGTILNSDSGEVIHRNHIVSPASGYPVEIRKNISVKSHQSLQNLTSL